MPPTVLPIKIPTYSCPDCYVEFETSVIVKNMNNLNPLTDSIVFHHNALAKCKNQNLTVEILLYKFVCNDFNDLKT